MTPDDHSLLTPREFELKMKIAKSTRYNWQRDGLLKEGRDFIKIRHKVYFLWRQALPKEIADNAKKVEAKKSLDQKRERISTRDQSPNWDY